MRRSSARSARLAPALALVIVLAGGCGPGNPGGPPMSGRVGDEQGALGPDRASNQIMMRDAETSRAGEAGLVKSDFGWHVMKRIE